MKRLFFLACVTACATDSGPGAPLARPTAYGFDLFPTQADCDAAKQSGELPTQATCQYQLLFCPDGTVTRYVGDVLERGEYGVAAGTYDLTFSRTLSVAHLSGSLDPSGSLRLHGDGDSLGQLWTPIGVAQVVVATCE